MNITQIIRTNVCDVLECIDQQREMEMKRLIRFAKDPTSPGTNIYVEAYNEVDRIPIGTPYPFPPLRLSQKSSLQI